MDLILVRHAIAFDRDPLRWPDDSARPLTPSGTKRFERAASGLSRVAGAVDVVFSSPSARAMQTARVLEDVASWPEPTPCAELEPGREPSEVIEFLVRAQMFGVVCLVGHEPLLGELAGELLAGPDGPAQPLKKGGAVCFRSSRGVLDGAMMLRWWFPPKILRKLGRA